MKKNDRLNYQQKTREELNKIFSEKSKELSETRMKYATGAIKDSSLFKKLKYEIALIRTLISQK